MAPLEPAICWQAIYSRDARFDGRFFAGATTTGLYCRNVCPVPFARPKNIVLFACAEAAEAAGFRPCKRCQARAAPGTPAWRGTLAVVSRALRLILEGALNEGSVEELAERLGLGARQLRRLFSQHLGASPLKIASVQRVHLARTLIGESTVPMTEVAFSSGFQSIREFNHALRQSTGQSPSDLRRKAGNRRVDTVLDLRLPFKGPFAWEQLLAFLQPRAIPGIEVVSESTYRRTIELDGTRGILLVTQTAAEPRLRVHLELNRLDALAPIVERVRHMFDLAADPTGIAVHLSHHAELRPSIERRPGLRIPGSWDGFEVAVSAVLGQRLTKPGSVKPSPRKLMALVVRSFGTPFKTSLAPLTYLFPASRTLLEADLSRAGMTKAQAATVRELARRTINNQLTFRASTTLDQAVAQLTAIGGIDENVAHYIAMRAWGEPDAFPVDQLPAASASGTWRPWRAYAAMHLTAGQ